MPAPLAAAIVPG